LINLCIHVLTTSDQARGSEFLEKFIERRWNNI
jgi:hypothetical protein